MPILEIGLFVLSLAAMFVAWRALQEIKALKAKLERMTATLYETRQEQRAQDEALQNRIAALDVQVQQVSGNLRFNPDQSLTELFEIEPRAQTVLASFHIGGCASCAVGANATLGQAVRERGADLDRVLTALNALPARSEPPDLRAPNVKFEL